MGNAKQNVINYQHVVRIPIGVNAALFFTKDNGKLQAYAYKWLDKKPGEKLFTGYITEYSFQTGTAAEFSYQDSKITKRTGLMAGAPKGLTPVKTRMKITGGTTRSGDISDIFSRIWCWLTGGTYVTEDDIASGASYGANGESGATGCDYSSIQQNPEGGGDPSGNYVDNGNNIFISVTSSPDGSIPPDPQTGWVNVYTPPDAGCGFDANGNQVLTNDGSCQGQWSSYQILADPSQETISAEPFNVNNIDPDDSWWDDVTLNFPKQTMPSFSTLFANFPIDPVTLDEIPGPTVYSNVGGDVYNTYLASGNPNACALRLSIALNKSGVTIPNIPGQTYRGADGKYYFLSSAKIYNFMVKTFGPPNIKLSEADGGSNGSLFESKLQGNKGIFIMRAKSPSLFQAYGHATIYNGLGCAGGIDHCYFSAKGGVSRIALWIAH